MSLRDKKGAKAEKTRRIAPKSRITTATIEQAKLARVIRERDNALEQQAATAEILKIISQSNFDIHAVLDALVNSAVRLCDADTGIIRRREGDIYPVAAVCGFSEADRDHFTRYSAKPDRGSVFGRAILERRSIHIPDLLVDRDLNQDRLRDYAKVVNIRSGLGVPLLSKGQTIGVFTLQRRKRRPFTQKQIELVEIFANQAVIAIENTRLFGEVEARTEDLRQSLEYQTATSEVLAIISRSPTDVQPVFEAIAASALRLCAAKWSVVTRFDGAQLHLAALHNLSDPEGVEAIRKIFPRSLSRGGPTDRAILTGSVINLPDVLNDPEYIYQPISKAAGYRSHLAVPMSRDGSALGAITVAGESTAAFSERHVKLLTAFADQAVIAIGNVRLFDEVQAKTQDLSEALKHQTGSANILRVIASSPTEVKPVLNAIVESACELCGAYDAVLRLRRDDKLELGAHYGTVPADWNLSQINPYWTAGRAAVQRTPVHVHDMSSSEGDGFPEAQARARQMGHRTILSVPMLQEGDSIGTITLRRLEVNPFTDKQIALLQTFADQAVIAIGNVRLFEEVQAKTRDLQEALTFQTGSANILKVIASSPTDAGPALNAIVESACELCDASDAVVFLRENDELIFKAHHGPLPVVFGDRRPISRSYVAGRTVIDRVPIHVGDIFSDEGAELPEARELSRSLGIRSILCAPLMRKNESIGAILLRRNEVQPFTEKQVALLQTFADQAVIAIGNVQLFEEVQARTRELSESLDQQVATSEVLQVISSSPGELEPVFQSMLVNATRLCEAECGVMWLHEGSGFRSVAIHGPLPPAYVEQWRSGTPVNLTPHGPLTILTQTHRPVHVADMRQDRSYLDRDPLPVAAVEIAGIRTLLLVPMSKEGELVGGIAIYRQEVRPFTDKQIELVSTFARQAVIAIENARLLKELHQRTHDLSQSLHELRAAQDRLVQTEKLASLGQLTAGIAHEIKNPLNFVNNFSALSAELTDELSDLLERVALTDSMREEVGDLTKLLKENLEKIAQHGKRADSIVKNMLLHSREGSGEQRLADINALVEESLNLAYHGARAEQSGFNIKLQRDFDESVGSIELFPQEITRALLNLISNGFYAATKRLKETAEEGFEPTLLATTKSLASTVEIRIRDNGTGIPPEFKEKIFNPFFTTKPPGEGTGLGLSMSHDIIVKQHGGRIDVDTEPGIYTEFIISLPRRKPTV